MPVVGEPSEEKKNTPRGRIVMSVRLTVTRPSGLKKSIRTLCIPDEVLPSTMSVDHVPPVTTCGNTSVAVPPIVVDEVTVGTGELVTVTGGEENVGTGGVGGKPRPKPG